ncbi:MAG: hypothetical protein CMJ49_05615 [Planctomycetaceae bacterium]|nr:hypothetical protein [Planctomycetaceae bacterium]
MRLGRASAYGLCALIFVARQRSDAPVQVQQISESTGLPIEYLRKILQRMTRARLIQSERGRRGGFRMTRNPTGITLLDIVEAIEGPVDELSVLEDALIDSGSAALGRKLKKFRRDTSKSLRKLLSSTRLSDLLA